MESTSHPTLVAGKGTMSFVADAAWWKAAAACCRRFARHCVLPAVLMTVGNIVLLIAYNIVLGNLHVLQDTQKPTVISNTDTGLLATLGTLMVALISAMAGALALMASIIIWLDKLHVFARAYARRGADAAEPDFVEAQSFIKTHAKFLVVFWLVASAYMVVPSIFYVLLIAAKVLMSPEFSVMFDAPFGMSRHMFGDSCLAASWLFLIVMLAYSFGGLVFASLANSSPAKLATRLFREMLERPLPPLAMTGLACLMNGALVLPFTAAALLFPAAQLESNYAYIVVSQLWLGVTSAIVFPLSVAPFCMITRHAESN